MGKRQATAISNLVVMSNETPFVNRKNLMLSQPYCMLFNFNLLNPDNASGYHFLPPLGAAAVF